MFSVKRPTTREHQSTNNIPQRESDLLVSFVYYTAAIHHALFNYFSTHLAVTRGNIKQRGLGCFCPTAACVTQFTVRASSSTVPSSLCNSQEPPCISRLCPYEKLCPFLITRHQGHCPSLGLGCFFQSIMGQQHKG